MEERELGSASKWLSSDLEDASAQSNRAEAWLSAVTEDEIEGVYTLPRTRLATAESHDDGDALNITQTLQFDKVNLSALPSEPASQGNIATIGRLFASLRSGGAHPVAVAGRPATQPDTAENAAGKHSATNDSVDEFLQLERLAALPLPVSTSSIPSAPSSRRGSNASAASNPGVLEARFRSSLQARAGALKQRFDARAPSSAVDTADVRESTSFSSRQLPEHAQPWNQGIPLANEAATPTEHDHSLWHAADSELHQSGLLAQPALNRRSHVEQRSDESVSLNVPTTASLSPVTAAAAVAATPGSPDSVLAAFKAKREAARLAAQAAIRGDDATPGAAHGMRSSVSQLEGSRGRLPASRLPLRQSSTPTSAEAHGAARSSSRARAPFDSSSAHDVVVKVPARPRTAVVSHSPVSEQHGVSAGGGVTPLAEDEAPSRVPHTTARARTESSAGETYLQPLHSRAGEVQFPVGHAEPSASVRLAPAHPPAAIPHFNMQLAAPASVPTPVPAPVLAPDMSGTTVVNSAATLHHAISVAKTPQDKALVQLVQQKVATLDAELEKYSRATENLIAVQADLASERKALDAQSRALAIERSEFRSWRDAETSKLDTWKSDQMSKMERECRVAVRQARAAAAAATAPSDRHERADVEALKAQVVKLKADTAAGDVRYKSAIERHRALIERKDAKIAELEAQVRAYEEQRLQTYFALPPGSTGSAGAVTATGSIPNKATAAASSASVPKGGGSARRGSTAKDARQAERSVAAYASSGHSNGVHASSVGRGATNTSASGEYTPSRYTQGRERLSPEVEPAFDGSATAHSPGGLPEAATGMVATTAPAAGGSMSILFATQSAETSGHCSDTEDEDAEASVLRSPASPPTTETISPELILHLEEAPKRAELGAGIRARTATSRYPSVVSEQAQEGGKREIRYSDGTKLTVFKNGTEKELTPSGTALIRFNNGDIKRSWRPSGATGDAETYLYAETSVMHTTYPTGGIQVYEFPSGQTELHREGGEVVEVLFPDGTHCIRKQTELT